MKNFKFLIPLIICIGSFMIHTNNVKADTLSTGIYGVNFVDSINTSLWQTSCSNLSPDIGIGACSINQNFTISANGNAYGYLYITNGANLSNKTVSFSFYRDFMTDIDLTGISLIDNTRLYSCEIYNTISNSNGQLYNLICPNLPSLTGNGTAVVFLLRNYSSSPRDFNRVKFGISSINGWSTYDTAMQDIISRLDTSNSNLNTIKSRLNDIKNNIATTNSKLNDIQSSLDNIKNNASSTASNTEQIKNDIKDSSIDNNNASSSANSWANKNATNGTITNLLTLPISLLQNVLNGIQTSCSNFSLGTLFDTELILPCINLIDLIGSTLFNVIDLLFSGFMILNIAKKLIKIFNDFTNLKSNQIDEIYSNGGGAS